MRISDWSSDVCSSDLLTFFADIGGILGGLMVSWVTIDLNPLFFVQRTLETVSINHFWIGMSKEPFLGIVIAAAGCRHGLMVGGYVQSLGRQDTSAVVQSIFLLIMFDAIFPVLFLILDLCAAPAPTPRQSESRSSARRSTPTQPTQ